jgi:hypothetical protein
VRRVRLNSHSHFQFGGTETYRNFRFATNPPCIFLFKAIPFACVSIFSWQTFGFIREQVLRNQSNYAAEAIELFPPKKRFPFAFRIPKIDLQTLFAAFRQAHSAVTSVKETPVVRALAPENFFRCRKYYEPPFR